jgi:uncharacterized membrane protein YecN with MAPEG domain
MPYPVWTATYAGALALFYVLLSAWVIRGRFKFRVLHGDGGDRGMLRRMRAHGNFAEYVPLCLLLAALLEMRGASATTMHALLLPLLLARVAHPFGMEAAPGSTLQYALRGLPVIATLTVLGACGLLLLLGG